MSQPLPLLECSVCGWLWLPNSTKKPPICPNCLLEKWDTPRQIPPSLTEKITVAKERAARRRRELEHYGPITITPTPTPVEWNCLRCKYKWTARIPRPPMVCPRCKSHYWNRPYTRKHVEIESGTHG